MLQYDLSAQIRNGFGKGSSRSLRRGGETPAVLYGAKTTPVALRFDTKILTNTLLAMQRRNAVFTVDIDGDSVSGKRHVMVKEIQTRPVDDILLHVDFCEVSMDEPITLDVPIKFIGQAKGVEMGGEMNVHHEKVALKGPILDIPDFIEIDVSDLGIGDTMHCGDLSIPAGIEILNDADDTFLAVQEISKSRDADEEEDAEEEVAEDAAAAEGGEAASD